MSLILPYFLFCFYFALLILDHTWIVLVVIWGCHAAGAGDRLKMSIGLMILIFLREVCVLLYSISVCFFLDLTVPREAGSHSLGSPAGVVENVVGLTLLSLSHQVDKWKQSGSSVFKSWGSCLRTHTAGFPQPWDVPWGCGKALLRVFEVL